MPYLEMLERNLQPAPSETISQNLAQALTKEFQRIRNSSNSVLRASALFNSTVVKVTGGDQSDAKIEIAFKPYQDIPNITSKINLEPSDAGFLLWSEMWLQNKSDDLKLQSTSSIKEFKLYEAFDQVRTSISRHLSLAELHALEEFYHPEHKTPSAEPLLK